MSATRRRALRACAIAAAFALVGGIRGLFADPVSFSADQVESVLAKGKEHTVISGHARVVTGKITITADRIELFGKDFIYLECSGGVVVDDAEREIRFQAPELYYDRDRKLSRATGPSVLEDRKNKLVLKAEWIEHDGQAEVLVAQVAVRILKEDLACRAEYAVYRRNDKALELTGYPSANKNGDEYRATRITVNTDTEEIRLDGQVAGKVASKKTSQADANKAGAAPAGATPPAAPAEDQPSAAPGGATSPTQGAPPSPRPPGSGPGVQL